MIEIVPVFAKKFDTKGIKGRIRKRLREQGWINKRLLQQVTQGWTGAKPRFRTIIKVTASAIAVVTEVNPDTPGGAKFMWLDMGTRIRWAVMSRDWRSKTKPLSLASTGGAGRVVIAGRRAMTKRNIKPRPGIEAREFRATVAFRMTPDFIRMMRMEFGLIAKSLFED